ncbi:MAG: SMP-30/gluconolactonase/LRE family protein [Spirochaetes bacterium]|nr:SMP-30/gluconolactonase/LRE family protein [Spirochaetota bacterium]
MKKKIIVIVVCAILVIAFIIKTLYDAGEFKKIVPYSNYYCTTVTSIPGPEDIVIDYELGIAYISSDDRRAFAKGQNINGSIFSYNLKSKKLTKLNSDFPYEFHPHGIDLITIAKNKKLLYVVNHRTSGHFIEKFYIRENNLTYVRSIENQDLMFSPNDLALINEDIFYVTNDHGNRSSLGKTIEEYLQLANSYVLFYDGKNFDIKARNIKYANGITFSPDKSKLFVASPVGKCIKVYTIEKAYNLTFLYDIDCNTGVDNITFDSEGALWGGCHPKLLTFVKHSKNEHAMAPSEIIKISFDGNKYKKVTELLDDGNLIQSSTVAVRYNSSLLIGSVFDTHILDCTSK